MLSPGALYPLQEDEEENYEIASPLLERTSRSTIASDENAHEDGRGGLDGVQQSSTSTTHTMDPRFFRHAWLRGCVMRCAHMKTVADSLPTVFYTIVTEGKMTAMVTVGVYLVFLSLWLPFWILSFVVTEWGVYALAVATVFLLGRSVLRMIAFPGASCRVRREIEGEFAKYSVQMLLASTEALADAAALLVQATDASATPRRVGKLSDLPAVWRRAGMYRDRVIAVYRQVLGALYQEPSTVTSGSGNGQSAYLTMYGNNRLLGDVGNVLDLTVRDQMNPPSKTNQLCGIVLYATLSWNQLTYSLTQPEARADGQELMERLQVLLELTDHMAHEAGSLLKPPGVTTASPNAAVAESARKVLQTCREMRDFCARLKPTNGSSSERNEDTGDDPAAAARQQLNGGAMETFKSGVSSILPMLDPAPHTSIFGMDVQRGCTLSRYQGARQIWVRRPQGGLIDVLHFPALNVSGCVQGNPKALLYCNPNAGLIEVAGGMSLVGGNLPSADANAQGDTWIDFYTALGFDVYLYNYAGYGRSYGTTFCFSSPPWTRIYSPGIFSRVYRIITSCLFHFQPTPDTLRADGYAVAEHMINEAGVEQLVIHGESIGGLSASGAARRLSHLPAMRSKLSLLICDRTFCNLEAVAQRLVGGWTGYAIRTLTLFSWSTDVAGDFLAAACPKVVANDAADAMISDEASLRSGIALWKEIHRGIATTKGIAWQKEVPLQYRMAEFENVCVNDSKYVAGGSFFQAQAPTWPNDKHVTVEEVFHFAACCKRIGKMATQHMRGMNQSMGLEVDPEGNAHASQPLIMEAWKYLSTCNGLTGSTLGFAVKRGFDATVAWLCTCLVFGGQTLMESAEQRLVDGASLSQLAITPADFDNRPPGYTAEEREGVVFPKPIPEVLERLAYFSSSQDGEIQARKSWFRFVSCIVSCSSVHL